MRVILYSLLLFSLSGCFGSSKKMTPLPSTENRSESAPEMEQKVDDFKMPTKQSKQIPAVELIWEVPNQPVVAYHISYGTNPNVLGDVVKVDVHDLEKLDHPEFGPVFRYKLTVNTKETIYISLQAENSQGLSAPTDPFVLKARGK